MLASDGTVSGVSVSGSSLPGPTDTSITTSVGRRRPTVTRLDNGAGTPTVADVVPRLDVKWTMNKTK